jgi:hypothetical protein
MSQSHPKSTSPQRCPDTDLVVGSAKHGRVQRSERFLIGRDSTGSTSGIWFHDIEECNAVYNAIKSYAFQTHNVIEAAR